MKRRITTLACIVSLFLLLGTVAWAGDGQIDIAEIPYTISSSGSYIVVDDLTTTATDTNGITIDADNVTLDLNGHAIIGAGKAAGTSGSGIYVDGNQYNIAIRNGTVRDWRGYGVYANDARNSQFEALRCYNNGGFGLGAGSGSKIIGNTCSNNGGRGIYASGRCTVTGNTCSFNDDGIYAGTGCTVTGNSSCSNGDDGIQTNFSTLTGNMCFGNTGDGIEVDYNCLVVDNICNNNGDGVGDGAGILATGYYNRITNNHCTGNDRGLDLDAVNNIVSGNTLQGNTTPLDAVAGNQLDILISELPYTISQPGMYRLSGDLSLSTTNTNGITIDADNVTLDLNGHALIGPGKAAGSTGDGIYVDGPQYNIAIRNGTVRDWRLSGINASFAANSQFEALRCYNNGNYGISTLVSCTVRGNTCCDNGGWGIFAANGSTVSGNTCYENGARGITTGSGCAIAGNVCYDNTTDGIYASGGSTVSGNTCSNNGGDGILGSASTISGNTCNSNDDDGIYGGGNSTVSGNTCYGNTGDGIEAWHDCIVVDNTCTRNGFLAGDGAGIFVKSSSGNDNCIEHNRVTDNDRGIDVDGSGNYIASNRASGNTTNYDILGGNTTGAGDLANVSF